jgi:hypothetical protein
VLELPPLEEVQCSESTFGGWVDYCTCGAPPRHPASETAAPTHEAIGALAASFGLAHAMRCMGRGSGSTTAVGSPPALRPSGAEVVESASTTATALLLLAG